MRKALGKNCPMLSAPIRIWVTVWVNCSYCIVYGYSCSASRSQDTDFLEKNPATHLFAVVRNL